MKKTEFIKKIETAIIKRLSEEGVNLDANIAADYVMEVVDKYTMPKNKRKLEPLGLYDNSWEPESD